MPTMRKKFQSVCKSSHFILLLRKKSRKTTWRAEKRMPIKDTSLRTWSTRTTLGTKTELENELGTKTEWHSFFKGLQLSQSDTKPKYNTTKNSS
ncbi:hypothetical protein JTE90_017815 [Oedothorax gibbosus]|uniref:Uncharacterized protein n=1 Tax=Oedothorax gibbosus TaxID=931172 RepID=A0AAV6TUI6_9ARAC|nr:hypothetical protein JTE90_017815 [Oedothorax gibbosus]